MVTGQAQKAEVVGRDVVQVMEVSFTTADGDMGWVDIPTDTYTPEVVHTAISQLADDMHTVHTMAGVHVQHIAMATTYPAGVRTPVVVVTATTPTGAQFTEEIPAVGFDAPRASALIAQRVEVLDQVAGL